MLQMLAEALPGPFLARRAESRLSAWQDFLSIPLAVELWNGKRFEFGEAPKVCLRLRSPRSLMRLLRPSLDSLGEAYVEGDLDIDGRVQDVIEVATELAGRFSSPDARHAFRRLRHSQAVDARAIEHHYDVSNAFYARWLDARMVYSCAYFRHPGDTLEQAQLQKIDHILTKIRLQPGQTLLDIGCGWGALAIRAAQRYGARCVGITLSKLQHELAREKVWAAGLEGQVDIRLMDYREVEGRFDRIVSVGMLEHVGLANLRSYFVRIHELLEDDGVAMNHGITSTDPESRESPLGGGRFIDRYVFPNGELPHVSFLLREMSAAALEATDVENLRLHYARTLDHWSARFEQAGDFLRNEVGEQRFRVWRIYLAGCAHAFRQNWIALHQVVSIKARAGTPWPVPQTRDYIYAGSGS